MPEVLTSSVSEPLVPPPQTRTQLLRQRVSERRRVAEGIDHGARVAPEREFVGYRYLTPETRPVHRAPPGGHSTLVLV